MNDLTDHVGRYAEDLAAIRMAKFALPEDDPRIVDFLQIETLLAANSAKAEDTQMERAPISDAREFIAKLTSTFCEVAGITLAIEAYLPPMPKTTPEIDSQVATLNSLRALLTTLLDKEGIKGRELRRVVSLIVRQEIALYHELNKNGFTLDQERINGLFAAATEKLINDAQKLIPDEGEWAKVVDAAMPRFDELIKEQQCLATK